MAKDKKKTVRLNSTCSVEVKNKENCSGVFYTTTKSGKNKPKIEKKKYCSVHRCRVIFKEK